MQTGKNGTLSELHPGNVLPDIQCFVPVYNKMNKTRDISPATFRIFILIARLYILV